jgi:hypothetical protein
MQTCTVDDRSIDRSIDRWTMGSAALVRSGQWDCRSEGYRTHRARARFFVRSSCSAADRTSARPSAVARLAPTMCVSDATATASAPATRLQREANRVEGWAQRRSGFSIRSFDRICFGPVGTHSLGFAAVYAKRMSPGGLLRLLIDKICQRIYLQSAPPGARTYARDERSASSASLSDCTQFSLAPAPTRAAVGLPTASVIAAGRH